MRLEELLADVAITEQNADILMEIPDISYDSRHVRPGNAFVAIEGFESDGHEYISQAMEKGAAVIICQKAQAPEVPHIRVENSRLALALMSRNLFGDPASKMKLIGVTGTNGKTTTTFLIKSFLEDAENAKVGLIGTNSNMMGSREIPAERTTPESYDLQKLLAEMAEEGCSYVVMEVSSHALILERVAGIRFHIGIFTNLTQDHLDFHGSMEEYARAKALLFERCDKGCVNIDDDYAQYMLDSAQCELITCSVEKNEADLVAKDIKLLASGVKFCALTPGSLERVELPIPGRFSVYNAMSVIACGLSLGHSCGEVAKSLSKARGVKGRVEVVPTDGDYTILIDYAHTPDALENVLRSMKEVTPGRVVAVFGCGGDRDRTKRPIMGKVGSENSDFVIITSDNPRTEDPNAIIDDILEGLKGIKTPYKVIPDRREAIAFAIDNHIPGDVIILAGKGHETYQIVGREKHHMDEREIVAECIRKRASEQRA